MVIDTPRKHIVAKAWEAVGVLRYVRYHIIATDDLEDWTFDLDGEEVAGREILRYGPIPVIPDDALTEKGRRRERELNKLMEV